jgi:hypothetical protein
MMTAKFPIGWHLAICPVFFYMWACFFVWIMGIAKTRFFAYYGTLAFIPVFFDSFTWGCK